MRKLLTIGLLTVIGGLAAQPYGNEWIDYDQAYFRVDVYETGIYRLSYDAMVDAGVPLTQVSSEQFAMYAREESIPIHVEDGGDGQIGPDDYIEFFGEGNDGWLDSLLYTDPSLMANPYFSLVNDTIHYFLTWTDTGDNDRMELENDIQFFNYLSPEYVLRDVRVEQHSQYSFGRLLAFNNNIPDYVEGEGWMGNRFGLGTSSVSQLITLNTTNAFTGIAPSAQGRSVFASANNAVVVGDNHHIRVYRGPNNNVQLGDFVFLGYELNSVDFTIPSSQMDEETFINHVVINDLNTTSDQFRVGYTEIRYSHTKDVSDLERIDIRVPSNPSQDKYHLDLSGVDLENPIVYSFGPDQYRIQSVLTDQNLDLIIPDQGSYSRVFIVDESEVIPASIEAAGNNGQFTDYSALTPDSAFIIIHHPHFTEAVQSYAAYRTNSDQDAVLVDVVELYDQFGGGIEKHFLSIRRFCDLALDAWPEAPGHLFLVGKSIFLEPQNGYQGARKDPELFSQNLLPSFGSPGSDILFTSGLQGLEVTPAIPTGRLSAITPEEVTAYLNKIIYNESRDPAAWMKNVLHFGGGTTEPEQNAFASYLNNYEAIIEDTCFGGYVHTFLKESSLPIVVNLSDSISGVIEEGVSILTFFGHAGGGQFDQSIDEPENLEWGAHPVVIVNSCFSGDIHQPGHLSTSEDYVIQNGKGAIGFIASVQQGFEGFLNAISTELYKQISRKNYGKSIGYLMQQTIDSLSDAGFTQSEARASLLMNLLEGDPATTIFSPAKPDLSIDASSISFSPEVITPLVDSIEVRIVLTNIGKATTETFQVGLIRTYPNGTEVPYGMNVDGLNFRDTIVFKIPSDFSNAFGINTFQVQVDLPSNVVPELDNFFNNSLTATLPITDGGVFPVIPYTYSIIPDNTVTLKASTGNPFIEEREYRLQLDTTDLYDSPLFQQHSITQSGGVLQWEVPITLSDSTVYYWRVAEWADDPEEVEWQESSFQYIPDRIGWGQSHYFQFKEDRFNNLIYDRPEREFDFLSGTKLLSCEVYGDSYDLNQSSQYFIDFQSMEYNGCTTIEAFHVAVIDPITLEPWGNRYDGQNPDNFFGNANDDGSCRNRVERYFIFRQNSEEQMAAFQNMIENEIPDGHYVLIYSWLHSRPSWLVNTFPDAAPFFTDFGAEQVAGIESDVPFITIGVKGDPSQTIEIVGDTLNSFIELDFDMPVTGNSGRMSTPRIGPAVSWDALYWEGHRYDPSDSATVSILGINAQGAEELIPGANFDITLGEVTDLDLIVDAAQYPFIRLQADFYDPQELDPIQLDRWQLLYAPVPEAALNPSVAFSFHNDTIQEGEMIELVHTVENISSLDMDSLLVRYWIEDANNEITEIPYPRQGPLLTGAVLTDTISYPSTGLQGVNTLWVEVNPIVPATGEYDQLEQYHFNNLGQIRFMVEKDRINPILDVTFDGAHILDGDLISARPEILIRLDDENPYLLMDEPTDTAFFSVFLTDPFGTQRRVYFTDGQGNETMTFVPASGESNISDILFRPDLEFDGRYSLLVIASDKSGNASGNVNYRIGFEVDHQSSITEVLNYPNPFTTSTRFVFTLTGVEVPDQIKIQIMTVTGKVVREVFKEELGDIRIGRNITDFAWDGTDQYGDRLANGVYLYRVIVKDQGMDVDVRATAASTFFKKGFGKMYLMR
ncbi:MAG: hypothetical protein HKN79_06785 [Flavobacteriales bacterium]|nr:hypothetical protein [Flavobacteriales bacterium]